MKRFRLDVATVLLAVVAAGCGHDTGNLAPARGNTDPLVFTDNFGAGIGYQAFKGSKTNVLSVDNTQKHTGTSSLKVTVPGPGDPAGAWAGGALTSQQPRDLSDYNARTLEVPPDSSIRWYRPLRPDVFGSGPTDRFDPAPIGLDSHAGILNITRGMVKRGYSDEDIKKVLGGNWLRLLKRIWGK